MSCGRRPDAGSQGRPRYLRRRLQEVPTSIERIGHEEPRRPSSLQMSEVRCPRRREHGVDRVFLALFPRRSSYRRLRREFHERQRLRRHIDDQGCVDHGWRVDGDGEPAVGADSGGARYCGDNGHALCDDFDDVDETVLTNWTPEVSGGGSTELDSTLSVSTPKSFRSSLGAADADGGSKSAVARLTRSFGGAERLRVSFDVRVGQKRRGLLETIPRRDPRPRRVEPREHRDDVRPSPDLRKRERAKEGRDDLLRQRRRRYQVLIASDSRSTDRSRGRASMR